MSAMTSFTPKNCDYFQSLRLHITDVSMKVAHLLGELVDNALDEDALHIHLVIDQENDEISVLDDGHGATSLADIFAIGDSRKTRRGKIGRHGIGLKKAGFALGDQITIESQCGRWHGQATVDMDTEQSAISQPELQTGSSYFRVSINKLKRQRFRLQEIMRDLGLCYQPALSTGRVITLNGEEITPHALPQLMDTKIVDDYFEGKHFKATAGITPEGCTQRGYHLVIAGNRLVSVNDRDGLGRFNGSRFFCWIELFEDGTQANNFWPVEIAKRGILGEEAFLEWLYPQFEELIEAASQQAHQLRLEDTSNAFTELMGDICKELLPKGLKAKAGKGTAGRGPGSGTHGGSGTSKSKDTESDPKGKTGGQQQHGMQIYISFEDGLSSDPVGVAKLSTRNIKVCLNRMTPGGQMLEENFPKNQMLIHVLALQLIGEEYAAAETKMKFGFDDEDAVSAMTFSERCHYYTSKFCNHYAAKVMQQVAA